MKRFVSIISIILAAHQAWATCTTIPGTSIQVGQGCFPRSSCPALNNPHDPINYGADNTGANDTSAAISSALAAGGDLYFGTPGTYKVDLTGTGTYVTSVGIKPPANTKIECAAGVTIKSTVENAHDNGTFWLGNGGNTVCGCDFQGPNNGNPPLMIGGNTNSIDSGNWLIFMSGGSNYTIEGNTFERAWGDAAVGAASDAGSPTNVTMTYNTCSLIPYYCMLFDGQNSNSVISHNLVIDGIIGAEWDGCGSGSIGTNLAIADNMLMTTSAGNCHNGGGLNCDLPEFNGEAYPGTCNYSGLTLGPNNYCAGCVVDGNGNCTTTSPWCGGPGQGGCTGTVGAAFRMGNGSPTSNNALISGNYLGTSGGAGNCACLFGTGCGAPGPIATPTPTPIPTPTPARLQPASTDNGLLF